MYMYMHPHSALCDSVMPGPLNYQFFSAPKPHSSFTIKSNVAVPLIFPHKYTVPIVSNNPTPFMLTDNISRINGCTNLLWGFLWDPWSGNFFGEQIWKRETIIWWDLKIWPGLLKCCQQPLHATVFPHLSLETAIMKWQCLQHNVSFYLIHLCVITDPWCRPASWPSALAPGHCDTSTLGHRRHEKWLHPFKWRAHLLKWGNWLVW